MHRVPLVMVGLIDSKFGGKAKRNVVIGTGNGHHVPGAWYFFRALQAPSLPPSLDLCARDMAQTLLFLLGLGKHSSDFSQQKNILLLIITLSYEGT